MSGTERSLALFLGCTIPLRARQYEKAAVEIARLFGCELTPLQDFACCGFPIKSESREHTLLLAARNLAVAEEAGLDILALCSSCASVLAETSHELRTDEALREKVNARLAAIGRKIVEPRRVRHFARWLFDDIGIPAIKEKVVRPLEGFRFAVHYGCHYLKPSRAFEGPEDPEAPHSLGDLVRATGAEVIDYSEYKKCCGGAVLGIDAALALTLAGEKLTRIKTAAPDAVVLVCPFCAVMYDDNQSKVAGQMAQELGIPILFLPQVLGLALGRSAKDMELKLAKNRCEKLIAAFADQPV
ncbi:MAG: CoB--CoM heterodisulfide reductase iron-sulfur subunit B family protein [Candidatus Eisenbacteria bacterium]|nr:CoB--CoM heterodisulfide reductase iron-sulfur subunit B family protein [Candidatus Eisenbacteria bacterium]